MQKDGQRIHFTELREKEGEAVIVVYGCVYGSENVVN